MSVNRYDPEDWGGLHMVPKPDGDWVCYEAWEHVNRQIAALKEENERLKAEKVQINGKLAGSRLAVSRLEARVAELAAPDIAVQGEPVAALLIGDPEHTEQGWELGDWDIEPNATTIEAFAKLAKPGAYQLYLAPQPAEQQPAPDVVGPINVSYTDDNGAVRRSPADCRHGVRYVTVSDTVYWPLSADDAQRLRSAELGRGDFAGPGTSTDVTALVEALEDIGASWHCAGTRLEKYLQARARNALAAYRKGGEV